MSGNKIAESNLVREALLAELGGPENKDGFRVSIVEFNDSARLLHTGLPVKNLSLYQAPLSESELRAREPLLANLLAASTSEAEQLRILALHRRLLGIYNRQHKLRTSHARLIALASKN